MRPTRNAISVRVNATIPRQRRKTLPAARPMASPLRSAACARVTVRSCSTRAKNAIAVIPKREA